MLNFDSYVQDVAPLKVLGRRNLGFGLGFGGMLDTLR